MKTKGVYPHNDNAANARDAIAAIASRRAVRAKAPFWLRERYDDIKSRTSYLPHSVSSHSALRVLASHSVPTPNSRTFTAPRLPPGSVKNTIPFFFSFTAVFRLTGHDHHAHVHKKFALIKINVKSKDVVDGVVVPTVRKTYCIKPAKDLLVEKFYSNSPFDLLDVKKITVRDVSFKRFRSVPLKGGGLQLRLCPDDKNINVTEGQCVLDYLYYEVHRSNSRYTKEKLLEELRDSSGDADMRDIEKDGVTLEQIMDWVIFKGNVSMYALNPFLHVTKDFTIEAVAGHTQTTLVFIVTNSHLYPITDNHMKHYAAQQKKLDVTMSTLTFRLGHERWCFLDEYERAYDENGDTLRGYNPQDVPKCEDEEEEEQGFYNPIPLEYSVVFVDTDDLTDKLSACIEQTNVTPLGIVPSKIGITAFENPIHPTQVFIAAPAYMVRRNTCMRLFDTTKYVRFAIFNNMSWARLFDAWLEHSMCAPFPMETYGPDSIRARSVTQHGGTVQKFRDIEDVRGVREVDIKNCYPSCAIENPYPYCFETISDSDEAIQLTNAADLPTCQAYVSKTVRLGRAIYSRNWYPSFFVQYMFKFTNLKLSDVTLIRRPTYTLNHDILKGPIRSILDMFPDKAGKMMVNSWIGKCGMKKICTAVGACTDAVIAHAMRNEADNVHVSCVSGELYYIRKDHEEILTTGRVSIRDHIVCLSYMKLHQLELKLTYTIPPTAFIEQIPPWFLRNNIGLISCNTDCIRFKVLHPKGAIDLQNLISGGIIKERKEDCSPGDAYLDAPSSKPIAGTRVSEFEEAEEYQIKDRKWNMLTKEQVTSNPMQSFIALGAPGCGKSTLLRALRKSLQDQNIKCATLCWTKSSAITVEGQTFDSFFLEADSYQSHVKKGASYGAFLIDEENQNPEKWYRLLLDIKRHNPQMIFHVFGDPQQNPPHPEYEDRQKAWARYDQTSFMHDLVDGNRIEMQYIEGCGRYDVEMKRELDYILANKRLPAPDNWKFNFIFHPTQCNFNIVKRPATRQWINKLYFLYAGAEKRSVCIGIEENARSCHDFRVFIGMYLIGKENKETAAYSVINSLRYQVTNIDEICETVTLKPETNIEAYSKEITIPWAVCIRSTRLGYADTVVRVESRTIDYNFNVYELDAMTLNEVNVAISRARTCKQIGMNPYTGDFKWSEPTPKAAAYDVRPISRLRPGFVYRISATDADFQVYIGKTCDLIAREAQHRQTGTNEAFRIWKEQHPWKMETIHEVQVLREKQLSILEAIEIAKVPSDVILNAQQVHRNAMKKMETVMPQLTEPQSIQTSYTDKLFAPVYMEKQRRWRVRDQRNDPIAKSKTFSHKVYPDDPGKTETAKQAAYVEATKHQRTLLVLEHKRRPESEQRDHRDAKRQKTYSEGFCVDTPILL